MLMSVGDLLIGYLLLRQATVAQEALDNGPSVRDTDFYAGKLAVAHASPMTKSYAWSAFGP